MKQEERHMLTFLTIFKKFTVGCQIFVKQKWMTESFHFDPLEAKSKDFPEELLSSMTLFFIVFITFFLKFWNDQVFEIPKLVYVIVFAGFSWLFWILSIACMPYSSFYLSMYFSIVCSFWLLSSQWSMSKWIIFLNLHPWYRFKIYVEYYSLKFK